MSSSSCALPEQSPELMDESTSSTETAETGKRTNEEAGFFDLGYDELSIHFEKLRSSFQVQMENNAKDIKRIRDRKLSASKLREFCLELIELSGEQEKITAALALPPCEKERDIKKEMDTKKKWVEKFKLEINEAKEFLANDI